MSKIKQNKINFINLGQLLVIIICFIIGFNFKSEATTLPSTILGMMTKIQTTNFLQNFIWLFTHNLTLMFVIFWISYFSFGVIGTLWCISNTFMLGTLAKVYLLIIDNAWLSLLFMTLELIASVLAMISSTKFRYERFKAKKAFAGNDELYMKTKKKQEKRILVVFAVIGCLLLTAAILETIVLSYL